jgi:predicted NAD-dependent protein-ADP-ribosyltransferase YbiA (DUF1768 family)
MTTNTKGFVDDLDFCSNFYRSDLFVPALGRVAPTGEHAFQALKTAVPHEQLLVLSAPSANNAKAVGRRVTLREDWDTGGRLWAMTQVVASKFAVKELEDKLYATDGPLVEWNYWHDTFWGVCTCATHAGQGKNMLGELLMMRRALRNL